MKALRGILRPFYSLRNVCAPSTCIGVFHALVHSRLTYGCIIWGGTYESRLKPLITLEKHFIRIICKAKRSEHSFPLFSQMNVLPLRSFYLYKVLRLFFVRSGGGIVIEPSRTRQKMRIDVPRPHIEFFKRTFNYIGPLWFNDLPDEIFYVL